MPTIAENQAAWEKDYGWNDAGEEWSERWGSSFMQWHGTLLPRIRALLPAQAILEIAPGFGRWTQFLKDHCEQLWAVDLAEKCIEACKQRFADHSHISCLVNDGRSLDMIPDQSVDLIFSFDSLVHVEDTVLEGYVSQFPRILKPTGVAVLHHSNLGEYARQYRTQLRLVRFPRLFNLLKRLHVLDDVRAQWRALSMSARKMQQFAESHGLHCVTQELFCWNTRHSLIDCLSMISRKDATGSEPPPTTILRNHRFNAEAENLRHLSDLYHWQRTRRREQADGTRK